MATIRTSNNPLMLIWAREEVGYNQEQAANAIGVSTETLIKAEGGTHQLTIGQLQKAADVYDFPFGYFYFSKPPKEKSYKPVPDFRIDPNYSGIPHFRLNLEIKKCRERRELYIELASSMGTPISNFKILGKKSQTKIGSHIRKRLGVTEKEISKLNYDKVYAFWKSKIENDGVLVYETQYIPEETGVIGASLYYEQCPVILIRRGGKNATRKLFTMLHEYAHLLLGESAINDEAAFNPEQSNVIGGDIEYRCNQLASEILIPTEVVNKDKYSKFAPEDMMIEIAEDFRITYSTAAVCLRKLGLISNTEMGALLEQRRKAHRETQKSKKQKAGIPRENIMRLDMGKPMFRLVLSAYSSGHLDLYDTSKILHLRVNKIDKLVSGAS